MADAAAPSVFISYSHPDEEWKNRIVSALKYRGLDCWDDSQLRTGDIHETIVQTALDNSAVAVLLVTPNFLASDQIQSELGYLRRRQQTHKLPLYPIVVEPCDWSKANALSGIQYHPADGSALSQSEGPVLSARLALIGLEVAALAGVRGPLDFIAVKLSTPTNPFVRMATSVLPDIAVTTLDPTDAMLESASVFFPALGISRKVRSAGNVDGFGVLQLDGPATGTPAALATENPPPGATWECLSYPSQSSSAVFTTGTVAGVATRNGREYLHLIPAEEPQGPRGMNGAPVIVNGQIAGVLESQGTILEEWFAIPAPAISAAYKRPEPISHALEPTPFNMRDFLAQLSQPATTALIRTDGFRAALKQDRLHMEHLVLGLYGDPEGVMRKLVREAGIADEAALRQVLSTANRRLLGNLAPAKGAMTEDTPLSGHITEAFAAASALAKQDGSRTIGRRHLTQGALSVEKCSVIAALRKAGVGLEVPPLPSGRVQDWLPDVSTDLPGQKDPDLLGIDRDVRALCSVIAAKDAALPLSIGLFGEWGSGKSFFMKEMEERIKQFAQKGAPWYCSDVVQLKFNAWHYIDTTLWASLTSEIFEGLATALSTKAGAEPENEVARVLADMTTSRDKLADAERQKQEADAKLADSERKLEELRKSQAQVEAKLDVRTLLGQATQLALEQSEVKNKLDAAAKEFNLPQATAAGNEVKNELIELRGIWSALWLTMRNTETLWIWLLALGLVAAAVVFLPKLARSIHLGDLTATVITALGSMAAILGPFLKRAQRALNYIQDARKRSEELIQAKRNQEQEKLEAEQKLKKGEVEAQTQKVAQAREKVKALETKLEELRADRRMLDFIKRRNESTDYSSHLGVIARAHKDFRELSTFLDKVKDEPAQKNLPRVERIVLYIDDLDRCPESKVMEVLQAVHLLLAFPLFVVVVGVDPRWLLHSVAERSPALRPRSGDASLGDQRALWESTPLNYLEKIFQIPFTLSQMKDAGFGALVDKLAGPKDGAKPPAPKTITIPAKEPGAPPVVVPAAPAPPPEPAAPPLPTAAESPLPLQIERWERDIMKRLFCLIPSPRAGKRFINLYRLIRATIPAERWELFVGDDRQGEHRQTLLLLAILTGYPAEAAEILRRLIEREHNETWWEFATACAQDNGGWQELMARLQSLRSLIPENQGCDVLRYYAPQVARYSFQSGRVLLAQRAPQTVD